MFPFTLCSHAHTPFERHTLTHRLNVILTHWYIQWGKKDHATEEMYNKQHRKKKKRQENEK